MATFQRKNTVKIVFPEHAQRPTAMAVHDWIADYLKLTVDQVEMIQIHTIERAIYVKLVSLVQYERLLQAHEGEIDFQYDDHSLVKVNIQRAEGTITTVRIFNLPSEIDNAVVTQVLSAYGSVKGVRHEMWNAQYKVPVHNGVRAARIEIKKHIPNKLIIGGVMAMAYYMGQPQLCHICGDSSHLRSECPRRLVRLPVTTTGRKPLLSDVVGGRVAPVNNDEGVHVKLGNPSPDSTLTASVSVITHRDAVSAQRDITRNTQDILHVITADGDRSLVSDNCDVHDVLSQPPGGQEHTSVPSAYGSVDSLGTTVPLPEIGQKHGSEEETTYRDIEISETLHVGGEDTFTIQMPLGQALKRPSSPAGSDIQDQSMATTASISHRDPRIGRQSRDNAIVSDENDRDTLKPNSKVQKSSMCSTPSGVPGKIPSKGAARGQKPPDPVVT